MEQFTLIHTDGTTLDLVSRTNLSVVSKATQKMALLSDDLLSLTIRSAKPISFNFGDTMEVFGKIYTLNQLPQVTKVSTREYSYDVQLEGIIYELLDIQFQMPANTYGDNLFTDLAGLLDALAWNIGRVKPNLWQISNSVSGTTAYHNITVGDKNCLQVLQEACSTYEVEFSTTLVGGKRVLTISTKVGTTLTQKLEYGKGKGLYQLQRTNVNNAGITTRLFCYGSGDNLGTGYRHTKLCLPGKERLASYIEDAEAIQLYGIKEKTKIFDIKPERVGRVTAKDADVLTFADTNEDTPMFDLNAKSADGSTLYLIPDTTAQVKFQTGNLAGYTFDINSYDHATKTFKINQFKDENGLVFPSSETAARQFAVGDEYIITDINLPQNYKDEAETKMDAEGKKELGKLVQPQVSYKLTLDEFFLMEKYGRTDSEVFHVGDLIPVSDAEIGVNKNVRIQRIERDLLRPHKYDITLSDTTTKTITTRVINEINEINDVIAINGLADVSKARRRWMANKELYNMVFDAEGNYYSDKIAPLAIETTMLSVGAKSQQFTLVGAMFYPNVDGNPKKFSASDFTLVHYAIAENIVNFTIAGSNWSRLSDATAYYIYARCPKANIEGTTGTGEVIVTTTQYKAESTTYYYFLIGVLNSVVDGVRAISLTYGASTINGAFITTGKIQSQDENSFIDLDGNAVGMGNGSNAELSWNKGGNGKLIIKGGIVQNAGGVEDVIGLFRGVYSNGETYYYGDEVAYTTDGVTSTYRHTNKNATRGIVPTNTIYWTVVAAGVKGKGISSVKEYYLASANKTGITTETTGWTEAVQEVTEEKPYLWNYEEISYDTGDPLKTAPAIIGVFGKNGVSISSVTEHYLATSAKTGVTKATSGWTTSVQSITSTKRYLWNYETISFSDGSTQDTDPVIIGAYGDTGNGISSVKEYYLASASKTGVTTSTSGWTETVQATSSEKPYLWNYESITYTNDSSVTTSPAVIGVFGKDGKGISSVTEHYLATSAKTGVTKATSGWTTSVQSITSTKRYLWNYETITYTDGDTQDTDPAIIGAWGDKGEDGAYYIDKYQWNGSPKTAPTISYNTLNPGNDWKETQPTRPGVLWYLWRTYAKVSGDGTTLLQNWSEPVRVTPVDDVHKIEVKATCHDGTSSATPYVKIDGDEVAHSYSRGLTLMVLRLSDNTVVFKQSYDTYGNSKYSSALVSKLNDYANGNYMVIIVSYDAIEISAALALKLEDFGGYNLESKAAARYAFYFIGNYGVERGKALTNGTYGNPYHVTGTASSVNGVFLSPGADAIGMNANLCDGTLDGTGWVKQTAVGSFVPQHYELALFNVTTSEAYVAAPYMNVVPGKRLTVSFEAIRYGNGGAKTTMDIYILYTDSETNTLKTFLYKNITPEDGKWSYYTFTSSDVLPTTATNVYFRFDNNGSEISDGTNTYATRVSIRFLKVEYGSRASGWCLSENDKKGASGSAGPGVVYRGEFSDQKTYIGSPLRVDVVKYNNLYYIARTDAGSFTGTAPTNTSKWNEFGGQFESVATELLFAEFAYIDNLGVHDLLTNTEGKRVHISQDENAVAIYDTNGNACIRIEGDTYADSQLFGGASMTVTPSSIDTTYNTGYALHPNSTYNVKTEIPYGQFTFNNAGVLTGQVTLNLKFSGSYNISSGKPSQGFAANLYVYLDDTLLGIVSIGNNKTASRTITISQSIGAGTHKLYYKVQISNPNYTEDSSYSVEATINFANCVVTANIKMSRYFANGNAVGCSSTQYIETLIDQNKLLHRIIAGNCGIELKDGVMKMRLGGTWYTVSRNTSGQLLLT